MGPGAEMDAMIGWGGRRLDVERFVRGLSPSQVDLVLECLGAKDNTALRVLVCEKLTNRESLLDTTLVNT